jgi:hypothetical protein
MGVNRGIAGSSGKVFALPVGDVLPVPLDVALGEAEVKYEDLVRGLVEADAEVIGFDVTVDEVAVVDVLDAGDHLVDEDKNGLEGELAEGLIEERLEGGSHKIHH